MEPQVVRYEVDGAGYLERDEHGGYLVYLARVTGGYDGVEPIEYRMSFNYEHAKARIDRHAETLAEVKAELAEHPLLPTTTP